MAAFTNLANQTPGDLQVAERMLCAWREGTTGRRQLDLTRTAAEQWSVDAVLQFAYLPTKR